MQEMARRYENIMDDCSWLSLQVRPQTAMFNIVRDKFRNKFVGYILEHFRSLSQVRHGP